MRWDRRFALSAAKVAAAFVLASLPARAQQVAYAAGVGPELDSASQAAITSEIDRARGRGLPVAVLVAKVREGRLKRASGPRIRTAVATLAFRLDSARAALGARASADELTAGADALAAGAGTAALRAVAAAGAARSVAAPLGSLAQLVASGVAPARAVDMIVSLLRRNAPAAAVLAFGNAVELDVGGGVPAGESALFRLQAIEASLGFVADAASQSPPNSAASGGVGPTRATPARRRP